MSDEAPPTYERDLKLMRSWRERLYAELEGLGFARTHRLRMVMQSSMLMIAFAFENNRNDEARFRIVKQDIIRRMNNGAWEHLT